MDGPNPLRAAWSVLWARRVRSPAPSGTVAHTDHQDFAPILEDLGGGLGSIDVTALDAYLADLAAIDPDALDRAGALAYWINLYNARAIRLAVDAHATGRDSVLRVPGAFDTRDLEVGGEALSLNDVEHGKIRRFEDPRIHAALVCGSLSCPTLRATPFAGSTLDEDLDDQMRRFLAAGAAWADRSVGTLSLSRVFLWYGADFARPHRMPTLLPASRRQIALAAAEWLEPDLADWVRATGPEVRFQSYDWGLGCAVG